MISSALSVLKTDEERNIVEKLYTENRNRFLGIAYSRLNNRADAEEAVQEAFLRIVRYPDRFFSIEPHKRLPYSIIIIKNVVLQMFEKQGKYVFEELSEDIPDCNLSVEDISIGNVARSELVEFIKTLSEAKKQAVILKGVYGLDNREIADVLGITESAVRRRIADAYGRIIYFVRKGDR